jgi:hypothetical protein
MWKAPMHLPARSPLYRIINKAIPHTGLLFLYGKVTSARCPFCLQADDSLFHFTVDCRSKWLVWNQVLHQFYSWLSFIPDLIYRFLVHLDFPPIIPDGSKIFSIVSTIHWQPWLKSWSHEVDSTIPIAHDNLQKSIPKIISLIRILIDPPDLD